MKRLFTTFSIGLITASVLSISASSLAIPGADYSSIGSFTTKLGSEEEGIIDASKGQRSASIINNTMITDTEFNVDAYGGDAAVNTGIKVRGNKNRRLGIVNSTIIDRTRVNIKGNNVEFNAGVDYSQWIKFQLSKF